MTLTAIVIDDSPLQQLATCKLVKENANLNLIAAFDNPKIGLEAVNRFRPDVLLLDVEMPGLSGFEILESLDHDCQVILNSTRSQFAFRAFKYEQVKDFVTKPMKKSRFEKSIDRVVLNQMLRSSGKAASGQFMGVDGMAIAG